MLATLVRRSLANGQAQLIQRLAAVAEGAAQARHELRWMEEELARRSSQQPQSSAGMADVEGPRWLVDDLEDMVRRREAGEPLQYVLGNQPFGPLLLNVRRPTLIPRPETEEWASHLSSLLDPAAPLRVLDLCTGSGCIPLLLLHVLPRASALGVDLSAAAVALARENAGQHGLDARFAAVEGDVFAERWAERWVAEHGTADVVTSNPPYIPLDEMQGLDRGVRDWEDSRALLGDVPTASPILSSLYPASLARLSKSRGLDFYALIAHQLPVLLAPRPACPSSSSAAAPRVVLEVGHDQAREVKLLLEKGPAGGVLERIDVWQDAMGKERVVVGY